MDNNQRYTANVAASIMDRFVNKLSKIELKYAVAVPLAIGAAMVITGVGVEAHHQGELLNQGMQALQEYLQPVQAYQLMYDPSMNEYIKAGVSGEIPAAGAKLQAGGIGVLLYGTAVTTAVAALAKGFADIAQRFKGGAARSDNDANAQSKLDAWRASRKTTPDNNAQPPTFKA